MKKTDLLKIKLAGIADAALITSPENIKYFTGITAEDSLLAAASDGFIFFTDERYEKEAQNILGREHVVSSSGIFEKLREMFEINGLSRIAVEYDRISLSEFERIAVNFPDEDIIATSFLSNIIDEIREIKDEDETEKIKAAQKIADNAFAYITDFIKPGMTEREIKLALNYHMMTEGADSPAGKTAVISGDNTSLLYAGNGDRKITEGDFIILSFGARYSGYNSFMTRTLCKGKPSDKQLNLFRAMKKACDAGFEAMAPEVSAGEIPAAAEKIIRESGYGRYSDGFSGHGTGIEIPEAPLISPGKKYSLKEGNVITAGISARIPGMYGVKTEDTVLITEKGCTKLSECSGELIII